MGTSFSCRDVWAFPIDDFLVLARPDVSGLYILNPTARLLWEIFRSGLPLDELVREFASLFDIPADVAAQDVTRTLEEWRSGLLSPLQNWSGQIRTNPQLAASYGSNVFNGNYFILGKNVRIILQTTELVDEIAPRLESLAHAADVPDYTFKVVQECDGFRIFSDERHVGTEVGVTAVRGVLFQEIVRSCRARESLAVLHAGACGSKSRCVVFPAATQAGKTTLAAVLMSMGLTFFSDDSVILERGSLSVPVMPFAIMVREGSWSVLSARFPKLLDSPVTSRYGQQVRFLAPEGGNRDGYCEQVGAIVFIRFEPDAVNIISPLGRLQALIRLYESGFWVAHDKESITAFLSWFQSTPSFTITYSNVEQAAAIIHEFIA